MATSVGRYGFSSSTSHALQSSRTGWFSSKTVKVLGALAITSLAVAAIAAAFQRGSLPPEFEVKREIQDLSRSDSWWPLFSEAEKHRSFFENCLSSDCVGLTEREVEVREEQALEAIGATGFLNRMKGLFGLSTFEETQELLRLNKNDPRDKLLFFSLEYDPNGALHPGKDLHVLPKLAEKYDIKFKLIRTLNEICSEAADAALTEKLAHVVIEGHGDPEAMGLQNDGSHLTPSLLASFPSCLSALDPAGKIVLSSCCTGSPGTFPDKRCFWDHPEFLPADPDYEPFAQRLATLAKREVVGAEVVTRGKETSIASLDPLMLSHPVIRGKYSSHPVEFQKSVTDPDYNIFRMFRPQYPRCSDPVDKITLQSREIQALNAIKADFVAKSLLKRDASFRDTEDWLRLCSEDPRKKMVYFLAKDDPDGTSNLHENKVLPVFADKFDLLLKEVSTVDGVCQAVRAAAKEAAPDVLVIDANGRPGYGLLLQEGEEGGSIAANRDFGKCFAGLKPNARIVLMDGSGGASLRNDPCDAMAQKMADSANRLVIAPVGVIDRGSVTVSSTDPVDLHHPAENSPTGNLYEIFRPGCQPSQHVRDWQTASSGVGATAFKVINASLSALKGLALLAIHDETIQHLLEVLGLGAAAVIVACIRKRGTNRHVRIPNGNIAGFERVFGSLSKAQANGVRK